jgi:hypothetical protein
VCRRGPAGALCWTLRSVPLDPPVLEARLWCTQGAHSETPRGGTRKGASTRSSATGEQEQPTSRTTRLASSPGHASCSEHHHCHCTAGCPQLHVYKSPCHPCRRVPMAAAAIGAKIWLSCTVPTATPSILSRTPSLNKTSSSAKNVRCMDVFERKY